MDALAAEQDALDERLEHEVRKPEVGADDGAGDDHDDGAGHDLALAGPVDLLQLGPALGDEAAASTPAPTAARLGLRRLRGRAHLRLAAARSLRDARLLLLAVGLLGLLLLLPVPAALLAGASGHLTYLVSRCAVCLPHQRQYFFASKRSGVFRFDFSV
jgi:hypothetical protein